MGLFSQRSQTTKCNPLSVVAKGCRLKGEICLEDDIQIDGYVEGSIFTGKTVIITPTGRIKGDIQASHVILNGLVEGSCSCNEINILSEGKMVGTINSQQLTIEKGGLLIGENRDTQEVETVTPIEAASKADKSKAKATTDEKNQANAK